MAMKIVATLGAIAAAIGIYFLLNPQKTEAPQAGVLDKEVAQEVAALQSEPVPEDLAQQAVYFSRLAQSYERLGNTVAARDYYGQAQAAADSRDPKAQVAYYEDVARTYEQEGNMAKAREYFEKQKSHLQAFLRTYPDDEPTKQAIKSIEAKLREIN